MRKIGFDTVVAEKNLMTCMQTSQITGIRVVTSLVSLRHQVWAQLFAVCQRLSQTRLCCSHFAYSSLFPAE